MTNAMSAFGPRSERGPLCLLGQSGLDDEPDFQIAPVWGSGNSYVPLVA
jgi:hypothetical protein